MGLATRWSNPPKGNTQPSSEGVGDHYARKLSCLPLSARGVLVARRRFAKPLLFGPADLGSRRERLKRLSARLWLEGGSARAPTSGRSRRNWPSIPASHRRPIETLLACRIRALLHLLYCAVDLLLGLLHGLLRLLDLLLLDRGGGGGGARGFDAATRERRSQGDDE